MTDDAATSLALPHLAGEAAPLRQAMAAHLLRGAAHIIEIGGAGAPITGFLTHRPLSVSVFDPKIAPLAADELNGAPCIVRHVAAKFQAAAILAPDGGYAVAMLGMSLKAHGARPALDEQLISLLRGAEMTVIDFAPALDRAAELLPELIARAGLRAALSVDLSLSDGVIERTPFAVRRLLKLVPATAALELP